MNGKQPKGTKAEIRAYKARISRIATTVIVTLLVVVIVISGFLIYSYLYPSSNRTPDLTQSKAAIVDHLSLTTPNQTFSQIARKILEEAGYSVDYYSGEKVDVEFYRNLPTHGYSLLVLRVHSTFGGSDNKSVILFTSERYDAWKYRFPVDEQLSGRLEAVAYSIEEAKEGTIYFGIMPSFVRHSMKGMFNNATILMMGCDGLMYTPMAEAFKNKEAKVYIGWSGPVSAPHTDQATILLLQYLIAEKHTIHQAVTQTMKTVGQYPADNSELKYHPPEAGIRTFYD